MTQNVEPLWPWFEANQGLMSAALALVAIAISLVLAFASVLQRFSEAKKVLKQEGLAAETAVRELLRPLAFLWELAKSPEDASQAPSDTTRNAEGLKKLSEQFGVIRDRGLQFTRAVGARSSIPWLAIEMQRVESIMGGNGFLGVFVKKQDEELLTADRLRQIRNELKTSIDRIRRRSGRAPIDWVGDDDDDFLKIMRSRRADPLNE